MEKRKNVPLVLALILCFVSVAIMIVALLFTKADANSDGFAPPPFEHNALQGIPDVPDGLGWNELNAQVYKAYICGVVAVDNGRADIWFTNPADNSVWLKLRVYDEHGNIIGETGIIKPGEYVKSIAFTKVPTEGDSISLKLMGYEPETYYSAGSAKLNITVTGGTTP